MGAKDYSTDDLELVLMELVDGSLADAEFSALVESLRASDELRKRVSRLLVDEAILDDEVTALQQAIDLTQTLGVGRSAPAATHGKREGIVSAILRFPPVALINRNGLAAAAAAAVVIVGLLVHNYYILDKVSRLHDLAVQGSNLGQVEVVAEAPGQSPGDEALTEEEPTRPGAEILARVISVDNLADAGEDREFQLGQSIEAGRRIRLDSGALELLFSTGAKVTAEGPVDFELTSLEKMHLQVGRIVAAVPRTARGYTIVTPTSELVDFGTQFGVLVDDSGETELHVFDGDVVARALVGPNEDEVLHAKAHEALRFGLSSDEPHRFEASEAGFVRRLGVTTPRDVPRLPLTNDLTLWYAADAIQDLAIGDLISVWSDILVGDNKYANEARQFDAARKPTYAIDDEGRPAVQFNGISTSLAVDPLDFDGAYTIFVVCSPGPISFAEERLGGFLFRHGNAPSLELSTLNDRRVRGWIWPADGRSNISELASKTAMSPARPSVIAYQYDSDSARTRLWLNGDFQCEDAAELPLEQTAIAMIGSHEQLDTKAFFLGAIYEVIVYDEALDNAGLDALNAYFATRYPDASAN